MAAKRKRVAARDKTTALNLGPPNPAPDAASPAVQIADVIAWGAHVSPNFKKQVLAIAAEVQCEANYLMACMAFESAKTFSPSVKNPSSGATGVIQFMPNTAKRLGTTVEKLAAMTAVEQLEYVRLYFKPWTGKLKTLGDLYMAILWPSAIGKEDAAKLFEAGSVQYEQNKGLDVDRDGAITKREAASHVQALLVEGLLAANVG